ncbi:THAP domain-containing protein 2-like isoform X2 [Athalia rosae]|uniref:THAP domain-containing protein 2-like isoform X2 n=1 Tax=Athalia rosae TaxID=37344 RepID=UPI002033EC44|nr:THAP domain-containing protein 2-like isoform X2 [Athalia rosae]
MPYTCRVPNCKATYGTSETLDVSFHQLPKNNERGKEWTETLWKKCNVELRTSDRLCSRHFDRVCFSVGPFGKRRLKSDAVPTIFDNTLSGDKVSESIEEAIEVPNSDSSSVENPNQSIEIPPEIDYGQSTSNSELSKASGVTINDIDE